MADTDSHGAWQTLSESQEIKDIQSDPMMQEIIKDVQTNGPMAVRALYPPTSRLTNPPPSHPATHQPAPP